ncbi:MAG TPA: hypothetical protein VF868_15220 [Bacteroidia bacterium]|jgi:hypothetical protein
MSENKQNSRYAHHRFNTTGVEPTVPLVDDITSASFSTTDLKRGEIAINLADDKAWFRSANGIIQFQTGTPSTPAAPSLQDVLVAGNGTGTNDIYILPNQGIKCGYAAGPQIDYTTGALTITNDNGTWADSVVYLSPSYLEIAAYGSAAVIYFATSQSSIQMHDSGGMSTAELKIASTNDIRIQRGISDGILFHSGGIDVGAYAASSNLLLTSNAYSKLNGATVSIGSNTGFYDTFLSINSPDASRGSVVQIRDSGSNVIAAFYEDETTYINRLGVGGGISSASAALSVESTTQGFLLPRMTDTQRNAIASPVAGLMIFNTSDGKPSVYDGTTWQNLSY